MNSITIVIIVGQRVEMIYEDNDSILGFINTNIWFKYPASTLKIKGFFSNSHGHSETLNMSGMEMRHAWRKKMVYLPWSWKTTSDNETRNAA